MSAPTSSCGRIKSQRRAYASPARGEAKISLRALSGRVDRLRGLAEQDRAFFRGADAALAGIDLGRPLVGLYHRGPRLDGFEPALQIREVGQFLALALPRHDPRIARHVGNRVIAREIR